jgi:hypothetical protein
MTLFTGHLGHSQQASVVHFTVVKTGTLNYCSCDTSTISTISSYAYFNLFKLHSDKQQQHVCISRNTNWHIMYLDYFTA